MLAGYRIEFATDHSTDATWPSPVPCDPGPGDLGFPRKAGTSFICSTRWIEGSSPTFQLSCDARASRP